MNEQLRELVRARLTDAVNCPAKDEIVEEMELFLKNVDSCGQLVML